MRPVIAVPRFEGGLVQRYMQGKYRKSLEDAGAQVRWIDLEVVDRAVEEALLCDGLLLPGGGAIDPERYGQVPGPTCPEIDDRRDGFDFAALKAFLPSRKPILAVCRGMQVLNVHFGGTLCQDIRPVQKYRHQDFSHRARSSHTVSVTGGTKLRAIFGEDTLAVNSIHQMAVEDVGMELTVSARSDDGFVEALELNWHPFCMGVQWHPEYMTKKSPLQKRLFSVFVKACAVTAVHKEEPHG